MTRVRRATTADAEAIAAIYNEGIDDRVATFETRHRTADDVHAWLGTRFPVVVVELAKAGFREVGVYIRHAQLDGIWRDVVVVEKLLPRASPGD